MKARVAILLVAMTATSTNAVTLYTCIGKNGEHVVTDNKAECKDSPKADTLGSYQRQPDDPRNQQQAAAFAVEEHNRLNAPAMSSSDVVVTDTSGGDYKKSSSPSKTYRNSLSDHYEAKRSHDASLNGDRSSTGSYANSLSGNYANPYIPPPRPVSAAPAQPPPPTTNFCHGAGGGWVSCTDSTGKVSSGFADPSGHAAVVGSDGKVTDMQNVSGDPSKSSICPPGGVCQ